MGHPGVLGLEKKRKMKWPQSLLDMEKLKRINEMAAKSYWPKKRKIRKIDKRDIKPFCFGNKGSPPFESPWDTSFTLLERIVWAFKHLLFGVIYGHLF